MSISPISSPFISLASPTAGGAVAQQNSNLSTEIGIAGIRDEIKLSKEAVSLLLGNGTAPAKSST